MDTPNEKGDTMPGRPLGMLKRVAALIENADELWDKLYKACPTYAVDPPKGCDDPIHLAWAACHSAMFEVECNLESLEYRLREKAKEAGIDVTKVPEGERRFTMATMLKEEAKEAAAAARKAAKTPSVRRVPAPATAPVRLSP